MSSSSSSSSEDDKVVSLSRRGSVDFVLPEPAELVSVWKDRLGVTLTSGGITDEDIANITLDEPNQRVIRYDCERTRGMMEDFKQTETRAWMERILTLYCKRNTISYKQGMNEVLAPFVALKTTTNSIQSWTEVYTLFKGFIDMFLPNMFSDEEFLFLQKCCALFKMCLRYHAPALSGRLDTANVTPEMYVTPWFLTLFASKTSLPAVMSIWHLIITQGDRHSFIFVAISLCLSHARLLRAAAKVSLPETITKISIDEESVVSVWKRSVKIRQHTPPFFMQQLINAAEWGESIEVITAPHILKQLGEVLPMTVRPMDLFRNRRSLAEGWKYVVLDCRPEWMISSGHIGSLPLAIPFDLESLVTGQNVFPVAEALHRVGDLLSVNTTESVPQWPIDSHICIMGLADSVIDATGLLFLALSKFSNVPRVSLLKGGFLGVHNEAPQELVDHDSAACPLCNGIPVSAIVDKPTLARPRAGSSASSVGDSSGTSSPMSTNGGGSGFFHRLKTFVNESSSVVASQTNSFLSTGSRFVIGTIPPIPTSKAIFVSSKDQLVQKCRLFEVMGRSPSSDIEANALLVVTNEHVKCFAAPLDMTVLTMSKCELRSYGSWKIADVAKISSKAGQSDTLMLYFSVEAAPDLVCTLINSTTAQNVVADIRRRFRLVKKPNS
jgi:hypothetical protein